MYSPSKKPTNFAPSLSSFSEEVAKVSQKINLDDIDSISRHSYYSIYQDSAPSQSVTSKNSISSSCSVFRVNISDSSSKSKSSQKKKNGPNEFNRSEIYNYPNLVKLNLDFFFTKKKSNRSKFTNDDKFQNVFAEFELNNDFIESRFSSEEEIQKFYSRKLEELQALQEAEIQKFIKKWEKAQIDATVVDFQDFCFIQGTKIILRDCANETLEQKPTINEEKINLRKTNEKNEKLFELMSLRHEKEVKLLVMDFKDQLKKYRDRYVDSVFSAEYQISFDENEASHISNDNSVVSGISNIKNKNVDKPKFDDNDVPIKFEEDSDVEALIKVLRADGDSDDDDDDDINILLEDDDNDFPKKKRKVKKAKPKKKEENFDNKKDFDITYEFNMHQTQRTPPLDQRKTLDIINHSQSQKVKKPRFHPSQRSHSYRPRFNNVV